MNTNRKHLIPLLVLVLLAFVLSACSGNAAQDAVNLMVQANSDGSKPATHSAVQWSPRNTCGISSGTLLLNAFDGDLKAAGDGATELSISTDEWLNSHMSQLDCIKAAE